MTTSHRDLDGHEVSQIDGFLIIAHVPQIDQTIISELTIQTVSKTLYAVILRQNASV